MKALPANFGALAHAVAHTARILATLAAKPAHPRKPEYDRQLTIYRGQWAAASADDRELIAGALIANPDAADLTTETVNAAVAALEG